MTVTVVSTYSADFDPSAAEAMQNAGVYLELVGPSTQVMAWHPKISRVLRDVIVAANVVHIHGLWEEIQHRAAVIARELGIPYLFSLHGTLEPWSMQQSRLKKQIYMAVRMKKNLSDAAALHYSDEMERELTVDWKLNTPAIVQPYAIDLAPFDRVPSRGMFRRAFPHLGDAPYVLFLGRLHPRKGLDILIPAFAAAAPPEFKLVIAGPPAQEGYEPELHLLVAQHKLQDRVIFTGMIEGNLRTAAYAEAQVFALPSYSENFGTAVIEALACGTAVIVSDRVALSRQIAANDAGAVIEPKLSDVIDALTEWLPDSAKCQLAGDQGRDWVFRTFDSKTSALAWSTHYDEIMRGEVGLHDTPAVA